MSPSLLAYDLGTTGVKAALFTADGAIVTSAFSAYSTDYPGPGWAEQSPHDWWNAVVAATREILAAVPDCAERLAGAGLCGMMNGCLLVDRFGVPLGNCLIHADTRSARQCERIAREVGDERAYHLTGNRIAPYFTLSKLAWMCEHQPDLVARAHLCVQVKDYIAGRLTGVWGITDRSDASLTSCYDMRAGEWSAEMIAAGGFPERLLPEVRPSATIVGTVTPDAAHATGLPEGLPIILGGGDGACATAGAGAVEAGDAYHYLGGTSWVAAVTQGYRPDRSRRVSVLCGLERDQFVVYGTVQSAGSSIDWFKEAIGPGELEPGDDAYVALERLAASVPAGSRGLFYLPYLAGERSPIWDAEARGVFFGLTSAHGRAELARAVYEGVSYALGWNLAALEDLGLAPQTVRVLGGGMRSPVWRSILAAVYNRPLQLMARLSEATSAGAAMAAGVGIGLYPDYVSAARALAPLAQIELPDPAVAAIYTRGSAFFRTLYPALADRFAALADYHSP